MIVNWVDSLALAYVGYGLWKGWRRGFAAELPSAVSWTVALLTGSGLYRWTERGLFQLSDVAGQSIGALGFVSVLVGSCFVVRKLRLRIRAMAEERIGREDLRRRLGLVAGGCRALFLSSFVVLLLGLAPIGFLRGTFSDDSLLGRSLTRFVRPVYQMTHHKEPVTNRSPHAVPATTTVPSNVRSKSY